MDYFVSGLHLRTSEALAGLISHKTTSPVDLQIRSDALPGLEQLLATERSRHVSSGLDHHDKPGLSISTVGNGAYYRMVYFDGTEFLLDRCGTEVWVNWPKSVTADEKTSYLLGPVLSFVLSLRGVTCLHASAVSIAGQAIAFVGPQGAGKSTMAAEFGRKGYAIIADDVVALTAANGTFLAEPGYPKLQLRTLPVKAGETTTDYSPRRVRIADEPYFDIETGDYGLTFEQQALPLTAMYFLTEPRADVLTSTVEPMIGCEALITLIANTWTIRRSDRPMRAREFRTLSRLGASVPVRGVYTGVRRPTSDSLCEIILQDFRKISSDSAIGQSTSV